MKHSMEKYNPHIPSHKTKGLTEKQKQMLDKHAKTHSKKHIDKMIMVMTKEGKSFAAAHKIATEKVGNGHSQDKKKSMPKKKGLTEKQKKLPKKLQEAIMKSKK